MAKIGEFTLRVLQLYDSFILQPMNPLLTHTDQNLCANWNYASITGFPF